MITEAELTKKAEYLFDAEGNQRAILVDPSTWRRVQETLKQLETYARLYGRFDITTEIDLSHSDVELPSAEEERQALVDSVWGKFADLSTSSEDFARQKQEEIELEDRPR